MSGGARVSNIDDLERFRTALLKFQEEARAALGAIDMECRRAVGWLKQDRWTHWQARERTCRQKISEARSALSRKRISTYEGPPRDTEEREALRAAERGLREAEVKLETLRRWGTLLDRAIGEYQTLGRPLGDYVANDLDRALAALAKMRDSLMAYLELSSAGVGIDRSPSGPATEATTPDDETRPDARGVNRDGESDEASKPETGA